ncbi:MAG: hypothetical protein FK733_04610 [Asgard group archaeon]|nr:hypothetical protein [Asgard group archaeon]
MNKLTKNMHLLSITIFTAVIMLLTLMPGNVSATEPGVLTVSHLPQSVSLGTNITVTATFDNDENITSIKILYCALEPEYLCHVPQIDMINTDTNTWKGSFVVLDDDGIIGYELHIVHSDGTMIAPNSSDYLGHDNIAEPFPGLFYFTIEITTPTSNAPLNIGAPGIVITYFVLTIIRKRKNR